MPNTDQIDAANNTHESLGALSVGSLIGLFLSGIVMMQVYVYLRVYRRDRARIKFMVGIIWGMDFLHSIMICIANYETFVKRFGDTPDQLDYITWSIGTSVALTALVTFSVHCFFIHRIYLLSSGNKWLTYPSATLALFRLVAASVSTAEMIKLHSYKKFVTDYGYVFTMGLGAAVVLDVVNTTGMCYYLRQNKSRFSVMNDILDTLVVYTVETGAITCITTIASLACWVSMPNNLIFLGVHFTIPKLYANSFVAILNSRSALSAAQGSSAHSNRPLPVMLANLGASRQHSTVAGPHTTSGQSSKALEISVHKTIHTVVDRGAEVDEEANIDSPYAEQREHTHEGSVEAACFKIAHAA
ncbi:hypothetical protein PHLGIDRAFT_349482 [Phlebiopsis gigantea 11061_1 CR5-6]|uniref:DUF6534 domain-containing protein n=1 Tax=Phlebiopsis gigantea (strain 11061_1 CR5-6) TaxID=745531 RepID=A0A0C3S1W4_PHLG1|nr:hypothetical protein PHLGIDRAFT_349482 [Phlebiopsis gigantea 11061_1 CR5-6]